MEQKRNRIWAWLALAAAIAVIGLLTWLIGKPLVQYARQPEQFRLWVNSHGFWGELAFVGMVLVQVVVALIPGEPFEIMAGYAFGTVEGTVLCVLASTVGSILVFLLVRRFGMRLVEVFFSKEKLQKLKFLKSSPKRDFLYLIIFMIPGTPKDLLCYVAGLTDIRLGTWMLICSLGRLPSVITSTVGGNALGTKKYWFAAIVFLVTMAISGLGILIYQQICKRHNKS